MPSLTHGDEQHMSVTSFPYTNSDTYLQAILHSLLITFCSPVHSADVHVVCYQTDLDIDIHCNGHATKCTVYRGQKLLVQA